MLKWFRNKSPHPEIVTDDPLATIRVHNAPLEIYAVSRVNPLFEDDDGHHVGTKSQERARPTSKESSPDPGDKSASSGYCGSNLYNSSSECSSGESVPTIYNDATKTTVLRDDAVTVLEQNVSFVKSILVAVRGGSPRGSKKKKKHSRKPSGSSLATLSPIPEGKIDYCIPRPVWPPSEEHVYASTLHDSLVDDALLLYTRMSMPALPIPRVSAKYVQNAGVLKNTISLAVERQDYESENVLRELSNTINMALEGNQLISHEELLRTLSQTINRKLGNVTKATHSSDDEEALKRLSHTISRSDPVMKMARAMSNSSSSSGGSSWSGTPVGRRSMLKESDYASIRSKSNSSPGTSDGEPVAGTSSSSSDAGSSGFSDCTRTPPSSSSDSPSNRYTPQNLSQPPVFVHQDLAGVSNSARNAMIYGTLCRTKVTSASGGGAHQDYEKLIESKPPSDSDDSGTRDGPEGESLWDTYYGVGVTAGDVRLKSKTDSFYHWSADRPDFTLDIPRAERLKRKIKAAKKRRCWCHLITSFVALIFFIVSVMVVSLMLTRGKRLFGSL